MTFGQAVEVTLKLLIGLLGMAFWLCLTFFIWGMFNGFNWDVWQFAAGAGKVILIVSCIAWVIYKIVNRKKHEEPPSPYALSEEEKEHNKNQWLS